jgi:hypothetical protein
MWNKTYAPVLLGGKRKTCLNIGGDQIGKVVKQLGDAHAAAQVIENIRHSNARPADTGFASPNIRINGYALSVIHIGTINGSFDQVKRCAQ